MIWLPAPETSAALAVASGSSTARLDVALRSGGADGDWLLEGDEASVAFRSTRSRGRGHDADGRLSIEDQLCQVSGRLRIDGTEAEVDGLGWGSSAETEPDGGLDSFRFLAGWLASDFGFSLLALRPRKARGHEADVVAAVVLEDPPRPPVVDPRLSTTYTAAGRPERAGLELWLEEESQDEGSSQYPRRAAGEVVGSGLGWTQGEFDLQASLLRWHSHGHEGPGVYVLGRRQ